MILDVAVQIQTGGLSLQIPIAKVPATSEPSVKHNGRQMSRPLLTATNPSHCSIIEAP
jgi:hypothetical protein